MLGITNMTIAELVLRRNELRATLAVANREELYERFDHWDFETPKQINDAYRLDRLEFLTATS